MGEFDLIDRYFTHTTSRIGGVGIDVVDMAEGLSGLPLSRLAVRGDGLFSPGKGMWVRRRYPGGEAARIAEKLRAALAG